MVVYEHYAYFYFSFLQGFLRVFFAPNSEVTGTEGGQVLCSISLSQLLRYLANM